ncbi:radical SAM protein [Desulfurobacterium indicum]|uniref:Radical SAM protein n=1 Tax=Desulfurobacterium indicum TaxID=1914305 RepID=A0A1R1MJB1_9BACT|nr:radical SAM protein [Desulfurobacterium indicum]OMH39905.1 radical SAM protein [Desulfurobacterium indicum]
MKYIFGPVFSRRLGLSLGVDLVPYKVCSMDCLYCEVGKTTLKTIDRKEYIPVDEVIGELKSFLSKRPPVDYVTFSGFGEPTLNSGLGKVVKFLKSEFPQIPVALLTNSSLLFRDDVIGEISDIDVVLPSFDAAFKETFRKINRPFPELTVELIKTGIRRLREETNAKIWLETLFVKGINDSDAEVKAIGDFIFEIKPERWQINTVVRPPAYDIVGLSVEELERIKMLVGYPETEIIGKSSAERKKMPVKDIKNEILELVKRRPCPVDEIADALGLLEGEVKVALDSLLKEGRVEYVIYGDRKYLKGKENL